MSGTDLPDTVIQQRMDAAARAAREGRRRDAAHLYRQLGSDIQAAHGHLDRRAIDAFEAMSRVIGADG